jgi:hypothetical protein
MSPEEILVQESQVRSRQMAVAAIAGVLLLVAAIISLAGPHAQVNELTLRLIVAHQRGVVDIVAAFVNAVAQIALVWTLVYLYGRARARSDRVPQWIPILAIVGGALSVVTGLVTSIIFSMKANDFVNAGAQTYDEANRLTGGAGLALLSIAAQLASLLIAISFVFIALRVMQIGLLPRFLGYVGMVAGALVLFPFAFAPIIQLYWLLAVAYIISGRWPSGLPPAWRTGRAEMLPSAAETRARRMAAAEEARGQRGQPRRGRGPAAQAPADETQPTQAEAQAPRARAANQKRKRKRRR